MLTRKKAEEWTTRLFLVAIGVYIIYTAPTNFVNWVVGLPLSLGPLLESNEFRLVFKITINRVSGKEVFQIQEVRNSTVFQGGVHYHGTQPQQTETPRNIETPRTTEKEWEIEEEFELEGGEYQEFSVDMNEGDRLVGFVEADGKVSAYLLGASSFRSFKDNSGFSYEWGREDPIMRTKVSYEATQTRTLRFVVSNGYEEEDGEDFDPVSVELKMRVEEGSDE